MSRTTNRLGARRVDLRVAVSRLAALQSSAGPVDLVPPDEPEEGQQVREAASPVDLPSILTDLRSLPAAPAAAPDAPFLPPDPPSLPIRPPPARAGRFALLRAALADRLPPPLRGGRLDPGGRGALALILVAVLAAAAAGLVAWRARPVPVAAPRPTVLSAGTAPSPSSSAVVVVALAGKVVRPGVVTLPAGSRVAAAVEAAGGPLAPGDLGLLNLARPLVDGEQILVGVELPAGGAVTGGAVAGGAAGGPAAGSAGAAGAAGGKVSLSSATVEQLDGLDGIGPVLAKRIVDWRTGHGGFRSVDQLREVTGIGEAKYAVLKDHVVP